MVSLVDRIVPPPLENVAEQVLGRTRMMLDYRRSEKARLDRIHDYLLGKQRHPFAPVGAAQDVQRIAKMSRVNIMDIVVSSVAQTMYVDGYRQPRSGDDADSWRVWQINKFDARQTGVHRAALSYGAAYVSVLPGDPVPVIKGYSPRFMTVAYGDDPDWPMWALGATPNGNQWTYRLFDDRYVSTLSSDANGYGLKFIVREEHGVGVTPVVRFLNLEDLDEDNTGEIEPLMELQDQIDHTTFNLRVAEHYGAFRQRWAIGWTAASEEALLKASAARLWTFEDSPDTVKVGEFEQTDLKGYLESREATLRYASVIAQMPPHYLLGQLVNLSAEALVAAEAGLMRKVTERQMLFGESWEQVLQLAGELAGFEVDEQAEVRWHDPESRALAATVDALGKMAQMLGVPVQELWEKIPGVTQQDIERWNAAFQAGDAFTQLQDMLGRQAQPPGDEEAV